MKIRNGFVSNSSSSSFCILGYDTNLEEVAAALKIKMTDLDDPYADMEKIYEKVESMGYEAIFSGKDNYGYIGFSLEGLTIEKILEFGIQPNDADTSIAGLRRLMNRGNEPTVCSGEM